MKNIHVSKTLSLVIACFFALQFTASAQWSQSPTAIYPTTLTKNVGIGTSTPTNARLQFNNAVGNKITLFDNGNNAAYGFGINDYNMCAYVPAGARFSIRANSYTGAEKFVVTSDGNVGVGTSSPAAHLDIVSGPCWTSYCWQKALQINNANAMSFRVSSAISYGIGTTSSGENSLIFFTASDGASAPPAYRMVLTENGKIGIGVIAKADMPGDYKLYVSNGIMTEKVKVALRNTSNWADYVFANDYKLRSLDEVESFVKENKHLPGVPSAEEVKESGIDVATMDAKLLEKIEELTLYMIELKKENEAMKTKMDLLEQSKK